MQPPKVGPIERRFFWENCDFQVPSTLRVNTLIVQGDVCEVLLLFDGP